MIAVVFFAIWLGIVSACCGVGGWAAWTLGEVLHDSWQTRSWVGVKATIESVSFGVPQGSGAHVEEVVRARYRYEVDGRTYRGERLGFSVDIAGDSFDGWHGRTHARLEEARAAGSPVVVWVNPANPGEAVLDRAPRPADFLALLPIAFLFGGFGLGNLWMLVRAQLEGRRQAVAG